MPKPSVFVSDDEPTEVLNLANIETISADPISSEILDNHTPLYLDPHSVIDGENVRPGETEGEHSSRIKLLAKQIREDGQGVPVVVRKIGSNFPSGTDAYKVVEGQGRIDALRLLQKQYMSEGLEPLPAWCVLTSSSDPWATAVKLNVQRRNYTDLQLSYLISQARAKYKWDGKGGGKKLAAFFGLTEQHLVEYNTIGAAPADVKSRLASGELSKSGALALLKLTSGSEQREAVAEKAKDIATKKAAKTKEETDAKYQASRKKLEAAKAKNAKEPQITSAQPPKVHKSIPDADPTPAPAPKKVRVQAKDVAEAARAVAEDKGEKAPVVKRNRTEIITAITSLSELMPDLNNTHYNGKAFLNGLLRFADGTFSPKQLQNRWNTLIGVDPKKAG